MSVVDGKTPVEDDVNIAMLCPPDDVCTPAELYYWYCANIGDFTTPVRVMNRFYYEFHSRKFVVEKCQVAQEFFMIANSQVLPLAEPGPTDSLRVEGLKYIQCFYDGLQYACDQVSSVYRNASKPVCLDFEKESSAAAESLKRISDAGFHSASKPHCDNCPDCQEAKDSIVDAILSVLAAREEDATEMARTQSIVDQDIEGEAAETDYYSGVCDETFGTSLKKRARDETTDGGDVSGVGPVSPMTDLPPPYASSDSS